MTCFFKANETEYTSATLWDSLLDRVDSRRTPAQRTPGGSIHLATSGRRLTAQNFGGSLLEGVEGSTVGTGEKL